MENNINKKLRNNNGFSLVELIILVLIIVFIIGIIMGIAKGNWIIAKVLGFIFIGLIVISLLAFIISCIREKIHQINS